MTVECKKAMNNCTCPNRDCPNHGKCCDCVKAHIVKGNLPFCLRKE